MLLAAHGLGARLTLTLDKRIPAGAGLGGGSSNAATVLRALDEVLGLGTPPATLRRLALGLGADVPFFLTGGAARVRGIGEEVTPIQGWPDLALVIMLPPVAVSTPWAFRAWDAVAALAPGDEPARLAAGARPDASTMVNDLEGVVLAAHPVIAVAKARLLEAGVTAAVMSGSGASVVGVVPPGDDPEAIAAAVRVADPTSRVLVARPVAADSAG